MHSGFTVYSSGCYLLCSFDLKNLFSRTSNSIRILTAVWTVVTFSLYSQWFSPHDLQLHYTQNQNVNEDWVDTFSSSSLLQYCGSLIYFYVILDDIWPHMKMWRYPLMRRSNFSSFLFSATSRTCCQPSRLKFVVAWVVLLQYIVTLPAILQNMQLGSNNMLSVDLLRGSFVIWHWWHSCCYKSINIL